jgi:hypothetical protein
LIALPAFAGQVYKCKGPKGEVTFTNIKCPENAAAQHYGSFAPTRDDPSASQAIAEDIQEKHEREYIDAEQRPTSTYSQMDANSDAASISSRDSRSVAGRAAQRAVANSPGAKSEEYEHTRKRWGARMAGPPPANYTQTAPAHTPRPVASTPAAPKAPVYTTGCTQNQSSVDCTHSDGSVSVGSVDAWGNGQVHGSDGSFQSIHRDPLGHSTTSDGTCVKDIYGKCQ